MARISSLLPVALDHRLGTDLGVIRVLPAGTAGPALAEQVPALVERNLDLAQSRLLVLGQPLADVTSLEAMLFVYELIDALHHLGIVHDEHLLGTVDHRRATGEVRHLVPVRPIDYRVSTRAGWPSSVVTGAPSWKTVMSPSTDTFSTTAAELERDLAAAVRAPSYSLCPEVTIAP